MAEENAPQPSIEDRLSAHFAAEVEPPPAAEPPSEPAAEAAPEPTEPVPDAVPAAEPAAAEGEAAEPAESVEGEGDEEIIEIPGTLPDLAEHLGVEVADLYNNVTIAVDTPEGRQEVTIGEWKDGWNTNTQAAKLQTDLKKARETWETERQQLQAQAQQQITEAAGLADQIQAAMLSEFNQVDWNALKAEDMAAWAAKRQDFHEASAKVQNLRAATQQRIDQFRRELEIQTKQQMQERLETERKALFTADPEFGDAEKGPVKMATLRASLQDRGFSPQEIEGAADHRLILMADDARKWRESQKSVKAVKKRVVKLAKAGKPGARQSKQEQQHDATRALRERLKKSGRTEDAVALISQLSNRR